MAEFSNGQVVQLADGRLATIRYVGLAHFQHGTWIGVELGDYSGKNDGSVQGERYFTCEDGRGMFVRPAAVSLIEQSPPALPAQPEPPTKPAAIPLKKTTRPSSVVSTAAGRRLSSVPDVGAAKRVSMNSTSPSPVTRSRPSSMLRSPTKSPTKQLSANTSTTSTPRTGTPSNTRTPSITMTKPARTSTAGSRTSMGPPPAPAGRRQSLAGGTSVANKAAAPPPSRAPSTRQSLAPKLNVGVRPNSARIGSIGSHLSSRTSSGSGNDTGDEGRGSPDKNSQGNVSPKRISPALARTAAMDRKAASPASSGSTASPVAQRGAGSSTAASREIEDLKTKLRLMEKKRLEDRDKLKAMEQLKTERDKFENIIQKMQAKYQPQQEELKQLRQELKDLDARNEQLENMQADHEIELDHALVDREIAEETAESYKSQVQGLEELRDELQMEVEILKAENAELGGEMTIEEKSSQGWLQMERSNERLKEALLRLRDMTQQTESDLKHEIKGLEQDLRDLTTFKDQYHDIKGKFDQSLLDVENLREQLDNAATADIMILELSEKNGELEDNIKELQLAIEDLESLRELNDELEINHVETEKEMQEDIDFKESVIIEQARRAAQQEQAMEDMEYTLSKFRELVTNLQSDLEDMRASHAVTETESEQLNSRSRAMMDLNMKLQVSAAKTQIKTIDLELRRLDAEEASEHLAIVQLFLPEAFHSDRDSVLALLRFKRVGFKANLLSGFVKERVNGPPAAGHEDDIFAAFDVLDKLSWVAAMCDRFVRAISHCSTEQFAKYEGALYELEPVERALNGWIDGLRRDDLKEKACAVELQRTIALMSHLAEVHISDGLATYADDVHMRALVMQSHLESAAGAISAAKSMVQRVIPSQGDEDELAQHFNRKADTVISQTRSAKVVISKAVRALEDLKTRSLSLKPDTIQYFEQCETSTQELAEFARQAGADLYGLLHEEGRVEPFTYLEVQGTVHRTVFNVFASSESDLFSTYLNKIRTLSGGLGELANMASDLEMVEEFERLPSPWALRSQELKSSKTVSIDAEEELRRLREDNHERATIIAMRDQTLEEASVKIELLESRMRDATKKNEQINDLERRIEEAKKQELILSDTIKIQNKDLARMEAEGEKWKKIAEDAKSIGAVAPGSRAGQERAVATARQMDALKTEIASLQAAVRYLREDNCRARLTDHQSYSWLQTPLKKPKGKDEQRKDLVVTEASDILNELLNLTKTAEIYDLSKMPKDRLAWRPAKNTPQHHVAKQREGFEAWRSWRMDVEQKGKILTERDVNRGLGKSIRTAAAKVQLHLPGWEKSGSLGREVEIVDPEEWSGLRSRLVVI
ncbi:dynein associated protein-domain-containing protein [Bisporella sp. PMI_857]|nr:dynein associated protein-domain-containing protein [Bisporella sp. PMI_857]